MSAGPAPVQRRLPGVGARRDPFHRQPAVPGVSQFGQRGLVERTFEYFASPTAPVGVRGDLGGLRHFSIVAAGVPIAETGYTTADASALRVVCVHGRDATDAVCACTSRR